MNLSPKNLIKPPTRPALDDISLASTPANTFASSALMAAGNPPHQNHHSRMLSARPRKFSLWLAPGRERWNIFELRSLLGIVSPDLLGACTTESTGRDVVLSGFFSSTRIFPHHHPDPEQLRLTDRALERLGIAHLADRPVARMSSGEAKRTLIARALVHDPATLLFDEPSNALDIAAQAPSRFHAQPGAIGHCHSARHPPRR